MWAECTRMSTLQIVNSMKCCEELAGHWWIMHTSAVANDWQTANNSGVFIAKDRLMQISIVFDERSQPVVAFYPSKSHAITRCRSSANVKSSPLHVTSVNYQIKIIELNALRHSRRIALVSVDADRWQRNYLWTKMWTFKSKILTKVFTWKPKKN